MIKRWQRQFDSGVRVSAIPDFIITRLDTWVIFFFSKPACLYLLEIVTTNVVKIADVITLARQPSHFPTFRTPPYKKEAAELRNK